MNDVRPPQIPEDIWDKVFEQHILDQYLALMRTAPSDLLGQLAEMTLSTPDERAQAASAIAFGHPDMAPNELFIFLNHIEPEFSGKVNLVHNILNVDALYPFIITEHAPRLVEMLDAGDYDLIYMLTMHNAQPAITSIFELLSPEKQLETIKANDYEIFHRAGAASNLPTMAYVVSKMRELEPASLNEMLTSKDNRSFDYAHHTENQNVIDYLVSFDIILDYLAADEEYQVVYAELIVDRAAPLSVTSVSMWQLDSEEEEEEEEEEDNDSVNSYSSN
jgi:hypothetical protein